MKQKGKVKTTLIAVLEVGPMEHINFTQRVCRSAVSSSSRAPVEIKFGAL